MLGTLVGFGVSVAAGGNPETLTLAIAAVGGGILALALRRLTITVTTALLGAWGVVIAANHLTSRPVDATSLPEALLPSATEKQAAFWWWFGLVLLGIVVQYRWPARREVRWSSPLGDDRLRPVPRNQRERACPSVTRSRPLTEVFYPGHRVTTRRSPVAPRAREHVAEEPALSDRVVQRDMVAVVRWLWIVPAGGEAT